MPQHEFSQGAVRESGRKIDGESRALFGGFRRGAPRIRLVRLDERGASFHPAAIHGQGHRFDGESSLVLLDLTDEQGDRGPAQSTPLLVDAGEVDLVSKEVQRGKS